MQRHVTTVVTHLPASATEIPAPTAAQAITVAATVAMTILQNAQAAISNVSVTNPITATATVRGSTIHAVKTAVILRPENVRQIPATTKVQTQIKHVQTKDHTDATAI